MVVVAPEPVGEVLQEVRPLARALAVELVRQELARLRVGLLDGSDPAEGMALNGHGLPVEAPNRSAATPDPSRRCNACARDLPLRAFEKHRRTCRQCRRRQQRERQQRRQAEAEDEQGLAVPG